MKEVTSTKYIADDGKEFDSKNECQQYEIEHIYSDFKRMCGDMNYIYTSPSSVYDTVCYWSDGVLLIEIKNKDEAERFCKWCEAYEMYLDMDKIVGEYLCCDCYGDGGVEGIESINECMSIKDRIASITNNLIGCMLQLQENSICEEIERNKKYEY